MKKTGWVKMRRALHESPTVAKLSGILQLDTFSVVGRLMRVWAIADEREEREARRMDDAEIDAEACRPGFSAALDAVGWRLADMTEADEIRFLSHNGSKAKMKAGNAAGQKKYRDGEKQKNKGGETTKAKNVPLVGREEAMQYAEEKGYDLADAANWWQKRNHFQWKKMGGIKITNWQSDCLAWVLVAKREREGR